jgi:hypothetical protein
MRRESPGEAGCGAVLRDLCVGQQSCRGDCAIGGASLVSLLVSEV